jgi:agmatinase
MRPIVAMPWQIAQDGGRMSAPDPIGQVDAFGVPRFAGLRTFARLPRVEDVERLDVAVLGAPFDGGATFRPGSRFGPAAIREASALLRPYSEPLDVSPFAEAQVADAGDAGANPFDILDAHEAIQREAAALHERDAAVLGLGGDHSVALPLLRAAAGRHGRLSLLQLDAHTDTWDSYYGAKVTHGTIFRRAAEEGLIDPSRSAQIGLRGSVYGSADYEENRELGFHVMLARDFDAVGVEGAVEMAREHLTAPVYVTVDVDVLDPAFAPGTGTPESGGLTPREALGILRALAGGPRIVSADVVEVSPPYDSAGATALAAANIAYDLTCLLVLMRRRAA